MTQIYESLKKHSTFVERYLRADVQEEPANLDTSCKLIKDITQITSRIVKSPITAVMKEDCQVENDALNR